MSGWRIGSWDRVQARGTVRSGVGELAFDAAVAMVDDFAIGEAVEVSLRPADGSFVVLRVEPVAWRAPPAPARAPGRNVVLDEVQVAVRDRRLHVRAIDEDGALVIDIEPESYQASRRIVFSGCAFLQAPTEMHDIAAISAFVAEDFVRDSGELTRHWPAVEPNMTVFRLEPALFGAAAAYVVAWQVDLR